MKEKFTSIFRAKCPVCLQGKVYEVKNPYDFKKFDKMYERCDKCNHRYEIEAGFWYGAMYVSYAMTVAFSVATFILTYIVDVVFKLNLDALVYFGMIVLNIIALVPITFRTSRLVWMTFFTSYDPEVAKEVKEKGKLLKDEQAAKVIM